MFRKLGFAFASGAVVATLFVSVPGATAQLESGRYAHPRITQAIDDANRAACGSNPSTWSGAGGTSFASPIMAGIQG